MMVFTSSAPLWVSVLFLVVIPVPVFLIARLARQGAEASGAKTVFNTVLGFYLFYMVYVTIACLNGAFEVVGLPPRIMVLTAVPLLAFLLIVVFNSGVYKKILSRVGLPDLVQIHIFRLIGGFFIILSLYEALPRTFAMIAGIGDILTALTSLYVADAIRQKKSYALPLTVVWNTFGLLDILATATMAFVLTKISIETGAQGVDTLAEFPFCYIPAFAPATIIFLHLSAYRKLLTSKNKPL